MTNNGDGPEVAFVLPDGECLYYAYPNDKGNSSKWNRNWRTESFITACRSSRKASCPRLGFWNSKGKYFLICADFDYLPNGFSNWLSVREHLSSRFQEAIVTSSFSDKAKCFFMGKVDQDLREIDWKQLNTKLTTESNQFLRTQMGDLFQEVEVKGERKWTVDTNAASLKYTYLNLEMQEMIADGIKSLPISLEVNFEDSLTPDNKQDETENSHKFRVYNGNLPRFAQRFINNGLTEVDYASREKFIRILLDSPQLAFSGFDIPVRKFGEETGASQSSISNWIKELCKETIDYDEKKLSRYCILELTDSGYKVGLKSKTYKATGPMLDFFRQNYDLGDWEPPVSIADGQWNYVCFKALLYFTGNEAKYTKWFKSIDGWNMKDKKHGRDRYKEHCVAKLKWYKENHK